VPLVFNQHFTGTMDHWDPAVTDGFATDREGILFDNAGVSNSSGEVPTRASLFSNPIKAKNCAERIFSVALGLVPCGMSFALFLRAFAGFSVTPAPPLSRTK
jgi:hypothetical protein